MKKFALIAATAVALSTMGSAMADGKATYDSKCTVCHAAGVAGAPLFGNKEAWAPRIALGMDAMLATVISGKNAMPPRGTCTECSDDELRAAIEYMVNAAK
jgi:cytochrome c5